MNRYFTDAWLVTAGVLPYASIAASYEDESCGTA